MDVLMPQLGETVAEGKITQWFKSAGDAIKPGDNLFEIETDKVSMEVPSTSAGVLAEIRVAAGEVAPVGAVGRHTQRGDDHLEHQLAAVTGLDRLDQSGDLGVERGVPGPVAGQVHGAVVIDIAQAHGIEA